MQNNDSRFDSLIAPLQFDRNEIQEFIRDNVCAGCLGGLVQAYVSSNVYSAHCIDCETDIMAHNFISKAQAEQGKKLDGISKLEIYHEKIKRNGPKRTPEEILKELGF